MESQLSQDTDRLDSLIPPPDMSTPATPELAHAHASIPDSTIAAVHKLQSQRIAGDMTPPPSTQVPSSNRTKTPTPPISQISTPPPTIELLEGRRGRLSVGPVASMSEQELESASAETLRAKVIQLQTALQEAKTSAAHHRLQYEMLSQESAAVIDRMAVEARMAQFESEVIHNAEQARAVATPVYQSPHQEPTIPVEKGLYQRMLRDLQLYGDDNAALRREIDHRDGMIDRQDGEIVSLTEKVTLMRERIRESRNHVQQYRKQQNSSRMDATPRSVYNTPHRSQPQPQPFAALLQASEMASQESARSASIRGASAKRGHIRNTHSMSSLPSTPQRLQNFHPPSFNTPSRQRPLNVPATAPMPRTSALRTPDVYSQSSLPVSQGSAPAGPLSDGTVSASDREDNDSEAETDIIDQDDEINESQASRAASQMLRSSQEQPTKRESFQSSGTMDRSSGDRFRQTRLFGAVRKANTDRGDEPPAKRARTGEPVGLGIAGVRN